MRVALICDWYLPRLGGIERQVSELASRLARAGHEITVITPGRGARSIDPAVRVEAIPAWRIPGPQLPWTPGTFRRIGQRLRSGDFDVVHVHCSIASPTAWATVFLAHRARLPTVCTVHSVWAGWGRFYRGLNALSHWSRWPVVYAGVSEQVAVELRRHVREGVVQLLPNAVDPAEWRVPLQPAADAVHVVSVMRLALRKRGAAVVRAFAAVRARMPASTPLVLDIAGDGSQRARLERLAKHLGVGDAVRFHGALPLAAVKSLLARSHVFVLAAELESFGLAALEARAVGLPVVAMQASGIAEFIKPGVNGLLARDDTELAGHLYRLCAEPELRAAITTHNVRTPIDHDWTRSLAAHLAAYARAGELLRACPPRREAGAANGSMG